MRKLALITIPFLLVTSLNLVAQMKSDEYYMEAALAEAKGNPEFPFGAVIVDNKTGEIICKGLNNSKKNPTWHGEIVAINNCSKEYPNLVWEQTTLYTTAEPCSMCQSAIIWAKISRMVFGTSMRTLLSCGWDQINLEAKEVNKHAPFYHGTLTGGILATKTNTLFKHEGKSCVAD